MILCLEPAAATPSKDRCLEILNAMRLNLSNSKLPLLQSVVRTSAVDLEERLN